MKRCGCCREEKDLSEFVKDKNTKDGYCYYCKDCKRASRMIGINSKPMPIAQPKYEQTGIGWLWTPPSD